MKKFVAALFVALLAVSASAIILEISFGDGIQHNASNISARVGMPSVGQRYYFAQTSDSNVSTNQSQAFNLSKALVDGTIVFVERQVVGNCTWEAIIDGNVFDKSQLNGRAVYANQQISWSAKPSSVTEKYCRLVFDLNIMSA